MSNNKEDQPRKNFESLLGTILMVPKSLLDKNLKKEKQKKKQQREADKAKGND